MITRRSLVQIAMFVTSRQYHKRESNGVHPGALMLHVHDVFDWIMALLFNAYAR